jgi:hypothetical protein
LGRILTPQTSHEGGTVKGSIVNGAICGLANFTRSTAPSNGMNAQRAAGGPLSSPAAAQRCAEGAGLDSGPPAAAQSTMPSIAIPAASPLQTTFESVARAHLVAAALMPAEPHIRSPFTERLAPQSLILEVIGLERVGPHCISAYRSHCLRRPARPDPTRLIRPRGTRDSDFRFPGCLRLAS